MVRFACFACAILLWAGSAFADDDLLSRVKAIEDRVAALEAKNEVPVPVPVTATKSVCPCGCTFNGVCTCPACAVAKGTTTVVSLPPPALTYVAFRDTIVKGGRGVLVVGESQVKSDCAVPSGTAGISDGVYDCFGHEGVAYMPRRVDVATATYTTTANYQPTPTYYQPTQYFAPPPQMFSSFGMGGGGCAGGNCGGGGRGRR